MEKRLKQVLVVIGVLFLYVFVTMFYIWNNPFANALKDISRLFALFGLLSMILSSIMAAFTREIFKIFGKSFIKVHHFIALFGFGLILMHPIFWAIAVRDIGVFVPNFNTWLDFWTLAGRPALYLIILAVLAGFLQKRIRKYWRYIHGFNYVAVVFGVIHGILLENTSLSKSIALQIFYIFLLVITAAAFVYKRYRNIMKKKRRAKKEEIKRKEETVEKLS